MKLFLSFQKCTALHKKYKALHNGIGDPKIRNTISKKEIQSQNMKYKASHNGIENLKFCAFTPFLHNFKMYSFEHIINIF